MNGYDLNQLIAQVAREKGISQEKLQEALENAMLKAAKKVFGTHKAIESVFDESRGEITLHHVIKLVGDDEDPIELEDLEEDKRDGGNYLLRQEERDAEINRLTASYAENQLHVDVARREYALDMRVGQFIRLPIHYQAELLTRQLDALKAERRSRKGLERDAIDRQMRAVEARLVEERAQMARFSERFGDLLLTDQAERGFGRIAAQAAKVVIQEKIRQAERDKIYEDFHNREEIEVVEIRRFEPGGDIVVALSAPDHEQQVEALLPRNEQIPQESYRLGKKIRCVIKEVLKESKGQHQIIVSQRHENFIKKLFEQNVPEIYHGTVEIKGVARLFGDVRGVKVAVWSKEGSVDPAGACIGPNGTRVKHVEDEIGGDKIEIVTWSSEPHLYVCNALQPADVSRLLIDHEARKMDVIVPDSQLSKAIGKRGKNVRLASMLTGWSLDIYAENKMKEREAQTIELLAAQDGVRRDDLDVVWQLPGMRTLEQLADATPAQMNAISTASAEAIISAARSLLSRRDLGEDIYQPANEQNRTRAWASWPRAHELLTHQLFDRCHQIGYGHISALAGSTPEALALKLGLTEHEAHEVIVAARAHMSPR